MSKKSNKVSNSVEQSSANNSNANVAVESTQTMQTEGAAEIEITVTPATPAASESKVPGRPVNPNSARQQKLANKQVSADGFVPLGRPANPNSSRQQKLAEIEARKASGEIIKRGRPQMTEEEKAIARAAYAEKLKAHQANMAKPTVHTEQTPAV